MGNRDQGPDPRGRRLSGKRGPDRPSGRPLPNIPPRENLRPAGPAGPAEGISGPADIPQAGNSGEDDPGRGGGADARDDPEVSADYGLLIGRMDAVAEALRGVALQLGDAADFADLDEQYQMQRELVAGLRRLRESVDRLAAGDNGHDLSGAVTVAAEAEALRTEAEDAHGRWGADSQPGRGTPLGAAWTQVWQAVRRMSPR